MSTTNVCNEGIKRQEGKTGDFYHDRACETYLRMLRQNDTPDVTYVEQYESYVEDQGEETIITVLREHPTTVDCVLLFDFDAIERIEQVKREIGGSALNIKVSLPNYAFERLRRDGKMSAQDYCNATYQMGIEEGWMKKHAMEIDAVSQIDCSQFP